MRKYCLDKDDGLYCLAIDGPGCDGTDYYIGRGEDRRFYAGLPRCINGDEGARIRHLYDIGSFDDIIDELMGAPDALDH